MRKLAFILLFIFFINKIFATHNRAGEILFDHISGYTFEFTIITYTKESSTDADRDSLDINFGDGVINTFGRVVETSLGNDVKYNQYKGIHTFSGPGTYAVSMTDPNLINDIINIDFGSSVDVPFYLEDTVKILDADFYGYNNSPILLQAPIDYANIYEIFVHNPNAFDIDGDSLTYEFITPLASQNVIVPGYQQLNQVLPGVNNNLSLNFNTGEMIWDAPQLTGIYSLEYLIREYRFGVCIGTMIRHMQIIVQDENNTPPNIQDVLDTCIIAGESISQIFTATDTDIPTQIVSLSATGGPLSISNAPATYTSSSGNPATLNFLWNTDCSHVRKFTYQTVIKAQDNYVNDFGVSLPLSDLHTWQIKVLAPNPSGFSGTITATQDAFLTWDSDYVCDDNNNFLGYTVWRKIGCETNFSKCDNNPSSYGYTQISDVLSSNSYVDVNLEVGHEYSYIIVAVFGDENVFGVINNQFYSAIDTAVCLALKLNVPVITNVSVTWTNEITGQMYIAWSKPKIPAFDTIANPGPYKFELYKSIGKNLVTPLFLTSFSSPTFAGLNDTIYNETGLNTEENDYSYQVLFYSGTTLLGRTSVASSIFISTIPSDNQVTITWDENVPWENDYYVVYRENVPVWDSIGFTTEQVFVDKNLSNNIRKCYRVKSVGAYSIPNLIDPIINYSQRKCETPIDNVPPCPVNLAIINDCISQSVVGNSNQFINELNWQFNSNDCMEDVVSYQIYYRPVDATDYILVQTINNNATMTYQHILDSTLAGCYHVYALDSAGNASISNLVCLENCEEYILPNTFTPNNDGQNDVFKPIVNRFIDYVEMNIYDRWGVLLFSTKDPKILWDGTYNGKPLPSATYFYTCSFFTKQNFDEAKSQKLSGFIELFR